MKRVALALLLLIPMLGVSGVARAQAAASSVQNEPDPGEHRLQWRWRRPGVWEYVATGVVGAAAVSVELFTTQPEEPEWIKPVWFDTGVRKALKSESADTREFSSRISDYTGLGVQAWAYLDAVVVPLATDGGNLDVAWQMTLINLQASALNVVATRGLDRLAVRQRPDAEPCEQDAEYHDMCFQGVTSSFPSGHTSFAFMGAGLVCAHHLNVPLYGNRYVDAAACAVAASAAASTGVLRLVADRHHATDVLAGAAIGATSGFLMPWFAHYWFVESKHPRSAIRGYTWLPIVTSRSFQLAVAARL